MFVDVPQKTADSLALKHLPWVSLDEIQKWLGSLNWHPDVAKEIAPQIADQYNGAFRKGMEVALRSVRIANGKLVVTMPDSPAVELYVSEH